MRKKGSTISIVKTICDIYSLTCEHIVWGQIETWVTARIERHGRHGWISRFADYPGATTTSNSTGDMYWF